MTQLLAGSYNVLPSDPYTVYMLSHTHAQDTWTVYRTTQAVMGNDI